MKTTARTLFLALTAILVTASCETTNKPPRGHDIESLITGRLAEVNPVDVVVLPIENGTGKDGARPTDVPLEDLRSSFHAGLVKRRYSPLSLEYVDAFVEGRAVEASYQPGAMQEQAVFKVTIVNWDDSALRTHGRLNVVALIHMLDAREGSGEALWGGSVQRAIDLNVERAAMPRNLLLARASAEFVEDVLASLPPRDPRR